jgi:hypothetical protein
MQEKEADCLHKVHREYKNVEQRINGRLLSVIKV